jgi:hypothetical protein
MTITLDLAEAATNSHTRRALNELSAAVVKKKKIIVVTGAGISCSCGIPVCSNFVELEQWLYAYIYSAGLQVLRWTLQHGQGTIP